MEKRTYSLDEQTEFQVTQTYQTPLTFGEAAKFTPHRMKDSLADGKDFRMKDSLADGKDFIVINNQQ